MKAAKVYVDLLESEAKAYVKSFVNEISRVVDTEDVFVHQISCREFIVVSNSEELLEEVLSSAWEMFGEAYVELEIK